MTTDALIAAALPTARALAVRHRGAAWPGARGYRTRAIALTADDLEVSALYGAWQAAGRWDPDRGVPWLFFARPRMRGQVADDMRAMDSQAIATDPEVLDRLPGRFRFLLDDRDEAHAVLDRLPARRADLLWRVLGCGWTLREAGKLHGISESRVSQIIASATRRLRRRRR